jgi:uncharacterized protein
MGFVRSLDDSIAQRRMAQRRRPHATALGNTARAGANPWPLTRPPCWADAHASHADKLYRDGRWHFQHGPIDIVLQIDGDSNACEHALQTAWQRFETVLPELVRELPGLRRPVDELQLTTALTAWWRNACTKRCCTSCTICVGQPRGIHHTHGRRGRVRWRKRCCRPWRMPGVDRAYVNNGGDIALHLQAWRMAHWRGESVGTSLGHRCRQRTWSPMATFVISADMPVRGVATSGWGGRSFSFGVADSVTVLAATAAQADVAATLIANAVNMQHPAFSAARPTACGTTPIWANAMVTVDVPSLPAALIQDALQLGLDCARGLQARGQSACRLFVLPRPSGRGTNLWSVWFELRLIDVRRVFTHVEEIHHEFGPVADACLVRGAIAAVLRNPYAGSYHANIVPMMEALNPLGVQLAKQLCQAMGVASLSHSRLWQRCHRRCMVVS